MALGPVDDPGGSLAVAAGLAVCLALAAAAALAIRRRRGDDDRAALEAATRDALAAAQPPGVGTHLEAPMEVVTVAAVDAEGDGVAYVPVVRVPLGTREAPGTDLLVEYVAGVLEAIHPVFADERVRHYDVRFAFGPDGLLVSRTCRRVCVPPALADRLHADEDYRARDLQRDLEAGADDTDGAAPVLWGECVSYGG